MWGKLEDVEKTLRHNVNQSEGMARYGWTAYDTREGGRQIIEDVGNKINLTTEFVKYSEGQSAGNWGLRIRGIPRSGAGPDQKTTVVFYVGMEAMGACATCKLEAHPRLGDGGDTAVHAVDIELAHPVLGSAGIHIGVPLNNEGAPEAAFIKTLNVTEDRLWQAKSTFLAALKDQTEQRTQSGPTDLVLNTFPGTGNIQLVQFVCHGGFEVRCCD
ncbi:Glycoside hydrolase family 63 protein [Pyrenophora tritici-repentis]|nr:Glycoside hydrolase family 63 protein [Pyrenophora tritici-repentis]